MVSTKTLSFGVSVTLSRDLRDGMRDRKEDPLLPVSLFGTAIGYLSLSSLRTTGYLFICNK